MSYKYTHHRKLHRGSATSANHHHRRPKRSTPEREREDKKKKKKKQQRDRSWFTEQPPGSHWLHRGHHNGLSGAAERERDTHCAHASYMACSLEVLSIYNNQARIYIWRSHRVQRPTAVCISDNWYVRNDTTLWSLARGWWCSVQCASRTLIQSMVSFVDVDSYSIGVC